MELQLALLSLGVILVLLVFVMSRYPGLLEAVKQRLNRGNNVNPPKLEGAAQRDANTAPRFSDAKPEADMGEPPVFEFSRAESSTQVDAHNVLLSDEDPDDKAYYELKEEHSREEQAQGVTPASSAEEQGVEQESSGPFTSLKQIDYWIKLSPESLTTQSKILSKLRDWDKINFPVQLHVLTTDDPHWLGLMDVQGDTEIADVVASYQLISQGMATTDVDLMRFADCVEILANGISAPQLPMASNTQAIEQSRALAEFYARHCDPVTVSVCAPEGVAFMGKHIETSAKQQGLEYLDGDYVRIKRKGVDDIILYRMIADDAPHFSSDIPSNTTIQSVSFTMLPALSQSPARDAKEMFDAAKAFSSRVKGNVRMPGRTDFQPDELLSLHSTVSRMEREMRQAGLEPGGQEVRRIFA